MLDRGERGPPESAREEPHTGQEADVDQKVLKKLKDTIMQRDNEISILLAGHGKIKVQKININLIRYCYLREY